jgi:hypothetical protein
MISIENTENIICRNVNNVNNVSILINESNNIENLNVINQCQLNGYRLFNGYVQSSIINIKY